MSGIPKSKRTDIYPQNITKATALSAALKMSDTEMINYLIEITDIKQITEITFENKLTNKKITITRRANAYKPDVWR